MYAIAVIWIMDMEWMNPKDLVRFPDPLHVSRGTRLPRTERRRRKPDQGCKHNLHMLVEPLDAPIKETLVSLMEFFLIFVCICGFGWQNWQNSWVITIFNFLVYLMVHGNPLSLLALKNNQSHVWAEAANPDVMSHCIQVWSPDKTWRRPTDGRDPGRRPPGHGRRGKVPRQPSEAGICFKICK